MAQTIEKKVTACDGIDLFYYLTYDRDMKETPKFIHPGAGMKYSSVNALVKLLNERNHPTLVMEPRGVGKTRAPTDPRYFTLDKYASDVNSVMADIGWKDPSIICQSFGLMPIAKNIAKTGNAKDIYGFNVSPNFNKTTFPFGAKIFFNIGAYIDSLASIMAGLPDMIKGTKRQYSDHSDIVGKNDLGACLSINNIPLRDMVYHQRMNQSLANWDVSDELREIKVPMHLVYGKQDLMVFPSAGGKIQDLAGGICTTDIIPGGHSVLYANPQACLKIMDKYE